MRVGAQFAVRRSSSSDGISPALLGSSYYDLIQFDGTVLTFEKVEEPVSNELPNPAKSSNHVLFGPGGQDIDDADLAGGRTTGLVRRFSINQPPQEYRPAP